MVSLQPVLAHLVRHLRCPLLDSCALLQSALPEALQIEDADHNWFEQALVLLCHRQRITPDSVQMGQHNFKDKDGLASKQSKHHLQASHS